jgi:hypothetical protein
MKASVQLKKKTLVVILKGFGVCREHELIGGKPQVVK